MKLTKVDYDINSPHGAVQACLRKKREVVRSVAKGGVTGIGKKSCCSFVSYLKSDGTVDNVFGNSRIRIPYKLDGLEVVNACAHGELTALWNVMEDEDNIPTIISIYIEMSPCKNCKSALNNLLPDGQEILYSFDYPDEVEKWRKAVRHL